MNVGAILGLGLTGRNRFIYRLRTLHGVRRLRHIGFRRLFLHAVIFATYLPS